MSRTFKYDLNLTEFILVDHDESQLKEQLYQCVHKASDYRLGRYLMTADELREAYLHRPLVRFTGKLRLNDREYLGAITGILASRGLWVVELKGKTDIFRGQSHIRPLPS